MQRWARGCGLLDIHRISALACCFCFLMPQVLREDSELFCYCQTPWLYTVPDSLTQQYLSCPFPGCCGLDCISVGGQLWAWEASGGGLGCITYGGESQDRKALVWPCGFLWPLGFHGPCPHVLHSLFSTNSSPVSPRFAVVHSVNLDTEKGSISLMDRRTL